MIEDSRCFTALFLGDVVGHPGRRAVSFQLPQIIADRKPDLVVVNGENAADDGLGLLPEHFQELTEAGAMVVTTGNHVWEKAEIRNFLATEPRLLRPANYPEDLPGKGWIFVELKSGPFAGTVVSVLNLQGRYRMAPIDDPFRLGRALAEEAALRTRLIFIDFHAEESTEKEAFPWAMDGLVTTVYGTHTHVATRDERILPKGTAMQSDIGMCGPSESIIGSRPDIGIERSLTQLPLRNSVLDVPADVRGLWVEADPRTGNALRVERVFFPAAVS